MHNCFLQISAVNQTAILYDDKWSSEWLHLFLLIILSLISYSNLIKYKILCIHTLSLAAPYCWFSKQPQPITSATAAIINIKKEPFKTCMVSFTNVLKGS